MAGFLSIKKYRKLLNEAQDLNYEHRNLCNLAWDHAYHTDIENDAIFDKLQKAANTADENQRIFDAGQRYLDMVEALDNPEWEEN